MHSILENWPALIETLRSQVEITPNFTEQVQVAVRVGEIYENQMADEEAAIGAYKKFSELDERAEAALLALARLYRSRGEWENLIGIHELQIEANPQEKKSDSAW